MGSSAVVTGGLFLANWFKFIYFLQGCLYREVNYSCLISCLSVYFVFKSDAPSHFIAFKAVNKTLNMCIAIFYFVNKNIQIKYWVFLESWIISYFHMNCENFVVLTICKYDQSSDEKKPSVLEITFILWIDILV